MKKAFGNEIFISIGLVWATIVEFLLPTDMMKTAAVAVLLVMGLDLVTKLFAIAKKSHGFIRAIKCHKIRSAKFAKGTLDKLIVFGVMLVISAAAYKLMIVETLANWFVQIVFTIMFLRDTISILENLAEAGVKGLGIFQKLIKKKMDDVCEENGLDPEELKDKKKEECKDESEAAVSDEQR